MANTIFPEAKKLASDLSRDGEFLLAARYWTGGVKFHSQGETLSIAMTDGRPSAGFASTGDVIELRGTDDLWTALLSAMPPRLLNDIGPALLQGLEIESDPLFFTQYFPALARLVEVCRPATRDEGGKSANPATSQASTKVGQHDAAVGRYIHLLLGGDDHRIYYEEAGSGIPLLMQHTAGGHGTQWRHLFECSEITKYFRLIAYDLPFHGKSIPPTGRKWWAEPYRLEASFLRSVPLELSRALKLDRPIFMGCSIGGALALDLALHNANDFRAVISVEGLLKVDGDTDDFLHRSFYHPQVSNEFKGRLMHGLTSPTAPEAFRQETIQTYKSGWPAAFLGDLHYYVNDFDLREKAGEIDTDKVAVHIMNGEYDCSGSWELGEQAHMAIRGSTWTKMDGVGHFPMCEDPDLFISYLMPVLERMRKRA